MGRKNRWAINEGSSTSNADNHTYGQVYIDLFLLDGGQDSSKITGIKMLSTIALHTVVTDKLSNGKSINISHLPVGVYIVKIGNYAERFIKL